MGIQLPHDSHAWRKANPTTSGGGCPSPGAARSSAWQMDHGAAGFNGFGFD
jgi:hypothetical protein